MSELISTAAQVCAQCVLEGRTTLADYVYLPEDVSLQGPQLGDPDYWPPKPAGRSALCEDHYRLLAPDARLDYASVDEEREADF